MEQDKRHRVSVVKCASTALDEEVVRRTMDAIEMIGDYGAGLRGARKLAIKINAGINRVVLTDGKQTELTEPAVVEGAIRSIRKVTDAEIVIGDAPTDGSSADLYSALGYTERLSKYPGVRLIDFAEDTMVKVPMAHSGGMFSSYMLPKQLAEADAFVSLAKMKAHVSVGCTLSIKNLFGWLPTSIYGAPRHYLHDRLIRLPRVLADLARHFKPCLNVIDGIVATNSSEWHGTPMRPGVIIAGTNSVATDSVGARVMGFDPGGDYPDHPYFYRRNVIKLAAELGVGPNRAEEIEVVGSGIDGHCEPFHVNRYEGDTNRSEQLRHGSACVENYIAQQENLADRYYGRYLALFDGGVLWDGADMNTMQRLERESGRDWQNVPQFVVRCVPLADETERMRWYRVDAEI
jgi:uncharacterized protein (DUF362 family)